MGGARPPAAGIFTGTHIGRTLNHTSFKMSRSTTERTVSWNIDTAIWCRVKHATVLSMRLSRKRQLAPR
eukprot:7561726-Pyramimonas_sp.AAC.1